MCFWSHVKEAIGTRGYTEAAAERGQRAVDLREARADAARYAGIVARVCAGDNVAKEDLDWARGHEKALKRR